MRFYLPAMALFAWAVAALIGVPPEVLRIAAPALTGIAVSLHIRDEITAHKKRERRRRER